MTGGESPAAPRLSAVVCTHNRAERLRCCLDALVGQAASASAFEVVVVDNASTDATRQTVEEYASRDPRVRYVFEGEVGLSHARNRGLDESGADIVAFLDDDAEADPDWVGSVLDAFEPGDVKAVGGRILPVWPADPPRWLHGNLAGFYTILDLGDEGHELEFPRYPFGANMSVRRDAARSVGGFEASLGRVGSGLLSLEERDFFDRLRAVPGRVVYAPRAVVHHHIESDRVTFRWVLRRAYAQGRSLARFDFGRNRQSGGPRHVALRALGRATIETIRIGSVAVRRDGNRRNEAARRLARIAGRLGYAREALAASKRASDGSPPGALPG